MCSVFFDEATIDRWISEDAPLLDLTSHMLSLHAQKTSMSFTLRETGLAACTEEAQRIIERCGATVEQRINSGTEVAANTVLLTATGPAHALLRAWKVTQNLLEYACGVASLSHQMKTAMAAVNPTMALLTTRKHAPGIKALALKATLSAGALPHRLGLSETILIFPQHIELLGGWDTLSQQLQQQKSGFAEKKIVIEVNTLKQAYQAIAAGADVLQFDKISPFLLDIWLPELRLHWPEGVFLAAGGINLQNVLSYAKCDVNGLVTSALHYAAPADIGVNIQRI